jgi:hypothetical protein
MPVITCIDDLKRIYERRVPRMFFDYCESGSWTEQTFRDNTRLRQDPAAPAGRGGHVGPVDAVADDRP